MYSVIVGVIGWNQGQVILKTKKNVFVASS